MTARRGVPREPAEAGAEQSPLVPDEPGTPPMKLLGLVTDAYTDALLRLAYAERDRHG
jgi:hypothetical protein